MSDFPMGTFDDDPGGPWIGPGEPCKCAPSGRLTCDRNCPHRLDQRPGYRMIPAPFTGTPYDPESEED